jgi:membrane associated rhomboid family serine protease
MTSVRSHLRNDYRREDTPVTTWLICGIVGAFLVQFLADLRPVTPGSDLAGNLALSIAGLESGRYWGPLTYWLLHSTSNLLHVGFVVAGVYFFGREIEARLGARRFVWIFGSSLLAGAITWSLVSWRHENVLVGASAGVYGLMVVYALLLPDREVGILFFFIPLKCLARQLALGLVCIEVIASLLIDVLARPFPFAYAPSAHLGGILAGWACYRLLPLRSRMLSQSSPSVVRTAPALIPASPGLPNSITEPRTHPGQSKSQLHAAVDRVLDKINSHGLGALTPEERRVLDEAKEFLGRR